MSERPTSERASSTEDGPNTTRRTFLKGSSAAAGVAALGMQGTKPANANDTDASDDGGPTNVILFVGDGQGRSQLDLGRYLKAYREDSEEFPLNVADTTFNMDRHDAHGSALTYPDDPEEFVTDSAAAGTAMATGYKTYNGAIGGVENDAGEFVAKRTVLEEAREMGYATGLVTTARMTHATPASFATHVPDRGQEEAIAAQYVRDSGVDVLFGGARSYFLPDGRETDDANLVAEAKRNGYQYATTESDLESLDSAPALGLFSESDHLNYVLDRQDGDDSSQPGLDAMAGTALDLLEARGNKGFFLLVEAGRIDHASHANYPVVAHEQLEADRVVGRLLDYAEGGHGETSVITTADHETGGLSLGSGGPYDVNFDVLEGMEASTAALVPLVEAAESREEVASIMAEKTGVDLLDTELDELRAYNTPVADILNQRIRLGWTTTGHTAENVPTFATGPNAEFFDDTIDNTDIAGAIRERFGGN
jgi:alkaline phosphatase